MEKRQLYTPEIVDFIWKHADADAAELMLSAHKHPDLPMQFIAGQIESRQKGRFKIPEWYANPNLIFPPKANLEQASSQATAQFKSRFLAGETLADITGGTGVDAFYLSRSFSETHFIEPDGRLVEVAAHNFESLGAHIRIHHQSAEEFLMSAGRHFDWIYLDPSRRSAARKKVVALEDYSPNILSLKEGLMQRAGQVLLKASPMLDIKRALKQLNDCFRVQVVSVDTELKELLFYLKPDAGETARIEAWNISANPDKEEQVFEFDFEEEHGASAQYALPRRYLYEPNASLMKAGPFKLLSEKYSLYKLHTNTHVYTSDEIVADFPGRIFEVIGVFSPSKKTIKSIFSDGIVNIVVRNYPLGANEIKKSFKLKDGGGDTLLFTTLCNGIHKVLHLKRLSASEP